MGKVVCFTHRVASVWIELRMVPVDEADTIMALEGLLDKHMDMPQHMDYMQVDRRWSWHRVLHRYSGPR